MAVRVTVGDSGLCCCICVAPINSTVCWFCMSALGLILFQTFSFLQWQENEKPFRMNSLLQLQHRQTEQSFTLLQWRQTEKPFKVMTERTVFYSEERLNFFTLKTETLDNPACTKSISVFQVLKLDRCVWDYGRWRRRVFYSKDKPHEIQDCTPFPEKLRSQKSLTLPERSVAVLEKSFLSACCVRLMMNCSILLRYFLKKKEKKKHL